MDGPTSEESGRSLEARIDARLKRLGLSGFVCHYIVERDVIEFRWPHAMRDVDEAVEFPADARWVSEALDALSAQATVGHRATFDRLARRSRSAGAGE